MKLFASFDFGLSVCMFIVHCKLKNIQCNENKIVILKKSEIVTRANKHRFEQSELSQTNLLTVYTI